MKKIQIGDSVRGTFGTMIRVKDSLPKPKELIFKSSSAKAIIALEKTNDTRHINE